MAITRKQIREIFPDATDEQVSGILTVFHTEADGIRDKLDETAEELKTAKTTISTLTTERDNARNDLTKLKESHAAEAGRASKKAAVLDYFKSKGMTEDAAKIAVRGCSEEINKVELDNGKIKDSSALDALISGDFKGLISTTTTSGAATRHAGNTSTGKKYSSREEIMKIKDTAERQKAISENMAMFTGGSNE